MSNSGNTRVAVCLLLGAFILFTIAAKSAYAGTIRFDSGTIDTATAGRVSLDTLRSSTNSDGEATVLIQFRGPVQPEWVEDCEKAGATLHLYVPEFAYLATLKPEAFSKIQRVSSVSWIGEMPGDLKVEPELRRQISAVTGTKSGALKTNVVILSVDEEVAKRLEADGHDITSTRKTQMGWFDTRLALPYDEILAYTKVGGVFRIEPEPVYELHGERAAQTAAGNYDPGDAEPNGPGYVSWLTSLGLNGGDGLIVQVQDDGVDQGIATGAPGTAHADIIGRIVGIFNATTDGSGDSGGGHGQINTGIIIGNAAVGTVDADGYKLGQGLAPVASVYGTKIFTNSGVFSIGGNTFTSMAKLAQDAGAQFSTNSWGAPVGGAYNADSAEFDALTRDADTMEAGNQQMIYFFSAGNSGSGANTIGAPGTAKNVITVGAGENSDADGTDGCGIGPTGADNMRDVISFSSRGPLDDGRLKPEIFSVGTHVQGPASTSPNYNGGGVCDMFWPAGQTNYARSSGTSHSCPTACGAGMIVYEWFRDNLSLLVNPSNPSPAFIKAVLAATATDMAGGADGAGGTLANVPNNIQGWGSVNLSTLVNHGPDVFSFDQLHLFTASSQEFQIDIQVVDDTQPVKIMLAWTDRAATVGANPQIVNDLDLEVMDGATTYLGNVFSNGFSVAGGTSDRLNNLEGVFLQNPGTDLSIKVKAFNVAGDGVPGNGTALDQDFALFVLNGTDQSQQGVITLTSANLQCSDTLTVRVSDTGLQGTGTLNVPLTVTTGDSESLQLTETGPATGILTGTIPVTTGAVVLGDNQLQVANGAIVTGTYNDADDGSGNPAMVQDFSFVDCVAPVISNVQVTNITSTAARITYDTNEPATSVVRYGMSCGAFGQAAGSGGGTSHTVQLVGLTSSTSYFFAIDATDPAGNQGTNDNGGSCFTFTTSERPDYFTEQFESDNDLDNQSLLFTPDGSNSFYSVCRTSPVTQFPSDPSTGSPIAVGDDVFGTVDLAGGATVKLYGVSYTRFYVGSNGFITFGAGSTDFTESLSEHFTLGNPRVSALYDDLRGDQGGGIRVQQLSDRAVVTWNGVPEFGATNQNFIQVEMFFDGRIRITHLGIAAADGIVGLSQGLGLPADFVESDLSAYGGCVQIAGTVLDAGNMGVSGVTINGLPGPPVTDVNGDYTTNVQSGFSGTATPSLAGYAFVPASRSYNNVTSDLLDEDYTAFTAQLGVTPDNRDVGSAAGNTTFDVANAGSGNMDWNASVISGSDWLSITGGASGTNSGTITCSFSQNTTTSQRVGTIRVAASNAAGSPKDVTVTQSPGGGIDSIAVVRPNGGEVFRRGRRERIEWTSSKGVGSEVKIELYKNGNFVRTIKASTPNDGLFKWRVRRSAGKGRGYKVKILSISNSSIFDRSDSNFRIRR